MGGQRCLFRNCNVSAAYNPGMHFFRFPIADPERYAIWIKMAGAENILKLPKDQQKNKCVCARHFQYDHFMNYKMDRLVRGKATPTLMRISKTQAYDYEQLDEHGQPKLITMMPPEKPHLIPPADFECPLGLREHVLITENEKETEDLLERLLEDEPCNSKKNALKRSAESIEIMKDLPKVPKILNNICMKTTAVEGYVNLNCTDLSENKSFVLESEDGEGKTEKTDFIQYNTVCDDDTVEEITIETVPKSKYDEMVKSYKEKLNIQRLKSEKTILQMQNTCKQLEKSQAQKVAELTALTEQYNEEKQKCSELAAKNAELQQLNQTQETNKTTEINAYKKRININNAALCKLKKEYTELQTKYNELKAAQQQNNTVSTSSNTTAEIPTVSPSAPIPLPTQNLTKAQLFNGIKKYLSATMIALLRMQMFGSSEREWKSDERQASVDILGLGERVYRYFTDEWRFYLPSLSAARTWANEAQNADEDEDL